VGKVASVSMLTERLRWAVVCVATCTIGACGGGGGGGGSPTPTATYTIGGTVSGLTGSGLVLRNNGGSDLAISANGAFTFSTAVSAGAPYNVTVSTQPTATPAQRCAVNAGSGVASAAVTNVSIACAVLVGKFLYVPNSGSSDVSAYSIDASTGALATVAGSPFPSNQTPGYATADPDARHLYVSGRRKPTLLPDPGASLISAYAIDAATGALSELPTSPFEIATSPSGTATSIGKPLMHSSGGFFYISVATQPNNVLAGMTINSATGALTQIPGTPIFSSAFGFGTFDSGGRTLYVVTTPTQLISSVATFSVSAPSGVLTESNVRWATGGWAFVVVMSRAGDFLFVPELASGGALAVLRIDATGAVLTPVTGSPFATGTTSPSTAVAAHPSKNFVYVTNTNQPLPPLPPAIPLPPPPEPSTIAGFQYDVNGVVTPIANSPFLTGGLLAADAAVDPTGRFLLVANRGSNSVTVFTIDQASGVLTPAPGSPFPTGLAPTGAAIDPSGRYFYVVNSGSNSVSAFAIDASSGALSLVGTQPTGNSPVRVEIVSR
jgi:6-phosphogluconolactonase